MNKISFILVGCLMVFANVARAQEVTEFGFMRILPGISEVPTTIPGSDGEYVDVLMLSVTISVDDKDTVGGKSYIVYIPNTSENREILKQTKVFWLDVKKRIRRNKDWVEPGSSEGYLLVYAWGQVKPWDPENLPTVNDLAQFGHVRLDHIVRWDVSVEFKFGLFKGKDRVDMLQVLVTKRIVSGNKVTFVKTVVYHLKNEHNESLFTQSYSFFVNFNQITRAKHGWADPQNFNGKLVPFIFNWGNIYQVKFMPPIVLPYRNDGNQNARPDLYQTDPIE